MNYYLPRDGNVEVKSEEDVFSKIPKDTYVSVKSKYYYYSPARVGDGPAHYHSAEYLAVYETEEEAWAVIANQVLKNIKHDEEMIDLYQTRLKSDQAKFEFALSKSIKKDRSGIIF